MSDTTTFWWVRHGPTHAKTMIGWTDLAADLSDTAQIARLAAYLPNAPVVSSDLLRARMTADAISQGRPRLPEDPDLRELNFGLWEDTSFAQAERRDAALIKAFWDKPGDVAAPDGESWNDLAHRVSTVVARLAGTAPDIIVVAHMGPILAQIQTCLRVSAYEAFGHKIAPLSVTVTGPNGVAPISHQP